MYVHFKMRISCGLLAFGSEQRKVCTGHFLWPCVESNSLMITCIMPLFLNTMPVTCKKLINHFSNISFLCSPCCATQTPIHQPTLRLHACIAKIAVNTTGGCVKLWSKAGQQNKARDSRSSVRFDFPMEE